jgi:hypothetical protein
MTNGERYRYTARTAFQVLDGLAVVVATRKRTVHRLDEVASDLWKFLEPGRTVDELVDFLLSEYEVDTGTARNDVVEFVRELVKKELLEVVA